jgi:exoribonuclease-2
VAHLRGSVVAWWEAHTLAFGVVAGEEKGRVVAIDETGREVRVPKSRLFYEIELPGELPDPTPEGRRRAGRRAAAARSRTEARATEVDVPTLWDLSRDRPAALTDAELSELALGETSSPARAAVAHALGREAIRFQRRGEGWEPRSAEVVEAIVRQRERESRRAADHRAVLDALAAAGRGEPFVSSESEQERKIVSALEAVCLREDDVAPSIRRAAAEALTAFGRPWDSEAEGAFRVLRAIGRFASDDENLAILRHGLRVEFPAEVGAAAKGRARVGFRAEGREDATGLEVVTVDGPHTREIDDGLSVEPLGRDGWRVGVHIADPSEFVAPGDPIDAEARLRATSHYFPDRRVPMLPPSISEEVASLVPGEERPSLSLFADVDGDGEVSAFRFAPTRIRVRERLDYDRADREIEERGGRWSAVLAALAEAAAARERCRERAGAVILRAPESEIRLDGAGRPILERRDPGTPAHRLVAEAMILAGALAARFAIDAAIPLIFRRQPAPFRVPDPPPAGEDPLVAARRIRRSMRRGEVGLEPGPHHGLGLSAYAQATSPLRRYQDLANHRQILSVLRGEAPLDAARLLEIAAECERGEAIGRLAEREQDRYWFLRWLGERAPCDVEAIVVETEPRPAVVLVETLLEQPAPFLAGTAVGERLRLRVEGVNPRADRLVLRPL